MAAILAVAIGAAGLPWTPLFDGIAEPVPPALPIEALVLRCALGGVCAAVALGGLFPAWRTTALVVAGVFLGIAGFEVVFGLRMVDPRKVGWALHPGDRRGHYLTWEFFRREPWLMPPGRVASMHDPVGTSIANTDSLPLLAIPLKAFSSWLPPQFQYLGAWMLVCVALQGAFAALLVRRVGGSWVYQLLGVALFLFNPVAVPLLDRAALGTARWLTMAALWLYVRPAGSTIRDLLLWSTLCAVAALAHPYVCMMLGPFAAAYYIRRWRPDGAIPLWIVAPCGIILLSVLFACWWVAGYFVVGSVSDLKGSGFGHWSMNMVAPIDPMWFAHLLPKQPTATSGQYEGFQYFGLGLLLLVPIALLMLAWRRPRRATAAYFVPALLASALLTVLALSPKVTFRSHVLVEMPQILYAPFALFRSSGRLFMPVVWLIIFSVLRLLVTRLPPLVAIAVLASALVFQWYDIAPVLAMRERRAHFSESTFRWDLGVTAADLFPGPTPRHRLLIVPNGRWRDDDKLPLMVAAAQAGLSVNDGYAARVDMPRLYAANKAIDDEVEKGPLSADAIYAVHPDFVQDFRARHRVECRTVSTYTLCVSVGPSGPS